MTFEVQLINYTSIPKDSIRAGADKINANFEAISTEINGLLYLSASTSLTAVLDKDLSVPPLDPEIGERYIIGDTPSGLWVDHATHIAEYAHTEGGDAWVFTVPAEDDRVFVIDEELHYIFNGSIWQIFSNSTFTADPPPEVASTSSGTAGDGIIFARSNHSHDLGAHGHIDATDGGDLSTTYSVTGHSHTESDITDFGSYAVSGHNHNDAYSALGHSHTESDITDFGSYSETGHTHASTDITDIENFAPLSDGLVPTANLGSGEASEITYLRGDQTWAILASGNTFASITAGTAIAEFDVVYADSGDSNKAKKAICHGTKEQAEVLGMATAAIEDDATGEIIVSGTIENVEWSWTPNKWLYLSETPGVLTQTPPTTTGQFAVPVGLAIAPTEIYLQPMTGWLVSDGDIDPVGVYKVAFTEASGVVSIFLPPDNAVITQITAVVSSAAAAPGGTIKVGTADTDDLYAATTVFDLQEAGIHVYDPFSEVGTDPDEIILTVDDGSQTFSGTLYVQYGVENAVSAKHGTVCLDFTEATSSPASMIYLPDGVVVTRCTVVVDSAASAGSPTVSIGVTGDEDKLFDETDCDLLTEGIYLYDPFVEQSGSVYLTITTDSQSFSGRAYLQYMAVS